MLNVEKLVKVEEKFLVKVLLERVFNCIVELGKVVGHG
jgi:hypothetical protein